MTDNTKHKENSGAAGPEEPEQEAFRVDDRRHWQHADEDDDPVEAAEVEPARPSIVDEYRQRAEEAELKLLEYIEAFKRHQEEQEQVRARLARDVERKVQLQFGELVGELIETLDDLDRSLDHARDVPEAESLARGVAMVRDRFQAALTRRGVTPIVPDGQPFDPNEAEALRVDPVDAPELDNTVTETLKPGYRLGERVIRAAQVAVGRAGSARG